MNRKKDLWKEILIAATAALVFLAVILTAYQPMKLGKILGHSSYDSYTLQAMAWRKGKIQLDGNYPWLELAIVNDEYFARHDKDDYMAYREFFGDVGVTIQDREGNRYYVSFPPVPSVPLFFLSFIFGENTPSGFVSISYVLGAFVFLYLLCRRLEYGYGESVLGAVSVCISSSAFFLAVNNMAGGVWFMAQTMALFLTSAAFFLIHGKTEGETYAAFGLLALAVGCRPFQIVYFFYFAYVAAKKHNFRILRTWKYYPLPAAIGGCYMLYNYARFGSIFEFGHNYLPEMMRVPDGQFSFSYLVANLETALKTPPSLTQTGLNSKWGFAFYYANVLFLICGVVLLGCLAVNVADNSRKKTEWEIPILLVLIVVHMVLTLMHKTLGAWQFGLRYFVDMLPATLMLTLRAGKPIRENRIAKAAVYPVAALILAYGIVFNIIGTRMMF